MRRGEIWWVELPSPIGRRPTLLLSRDSAYKIRTSITVAMVTRNVRGIPVEVLIGPEEGMPVECAVSLDNILTIPKSRLRQRITALPPTKMTAVAKAVVFALDLGI